MVIHPLAICLLDLAQAQIIVDIGNGEFAKHDYRRSAKILAVRRERHFLYQSIALQ